MNRQNFENNFELWRKRCRENDCNICPLAIKYFDAIVKCVEKKLGLQPSDSHHVIYTGKFYSYSDEYLEFDNFCGLEYHITGYVTMIICPREYISDSRIRGYLNHWRIANSDSFIQAMKELDETTTYPS